MKKIQYTSSTVSIISIITNKCIPKSELTSIQMQLWLKRWFMFVMDLISEHKLVKSNAKVKLKRKQKPKKKIKNFEIEMMRFLIFIWLKKLCDYAFTHRNRILYLKVVNLLRPLTQQLYWYDAVTFNFYWDSFETLSQNSHFHFTLWLVWDKGGWKLANIYWDSFDIVTLLFVWKKLSNVTYDCIRVCLSMRNLNM